MIHLNVRRILALALGALLVILAAPAVRAEIIQQVLVKVNGDIITKTDLEARQIAALRQKGQTNLSDEELKKAIAQITPQVLVDAVDEMLLLQRGRDLGYHLSDEQFKQVVENIRKENHIDTEEQFQAALKQENMTMADLRRNLEKQMVISRVQQNEVFSHIAISEEEARKYYEAHKNEFTTPPTLMLREVLVKVPGGPGEAINVGVDEEAKAKAEALRAKVAGGESIEKVVADSSDAPSKANGGLIGPINRNDLAPGLQKMLEPLKTGDLTPVVRTQAGYQFFKIESKTEVKVLPFEQARDQIADKVFNQKRVGEFEKYMAKLRSEAIIEWKNPELKKLYEQELTQLDKRTATGDSSVGAGQ